MNSNIIKHFDLISSESELEEFIEDNKSAIEILDRIHPQLRKHFPNTRFSLELCDELEWTTEQKLLLNVHVREEVFFNGILDHFNDIYEKIDPLVRDEFCPIVLFPFLSNENYDKMSYNSVINLVARTAYFNGDFDKNLQREMTIRDIPKDQRVKEVVEYCRNHPNPDFSDVVYDLQLDIFDVDDIIDEKGLKVRY